MNRAIASRTGEGPHCFAAARRDGASSLTARIDREQESLPVHGQETPRGART
jgi:hypothetical protein